MKKTIINALSHLLYIFHSRFSGRVRVYLILSFMLAGQLYPNVLCAQTAESKITFGMQNKTLEYGLNELGKLSDFRITFTLSQVSKYDNITINKGTRTIRETLSLLLSNTDLTFTIKNESIVIIERSVSKPKTAESASLRQISGIVTDVEKQPLPGVSIRVKGNNRGVITDENGRYSIEVEKGDVIVLSYIGFNSQEVQAKNGEIVNIALIPNSINLSEALVVSTGYQTVTKERATGAYAKVNKDKLNQRRLSDLGSILDGQIAGYSDGRIRGTSSMLGVANPLFVIDGFPVENTRYDANGSLIENLPGLNLEDIESITVLKDAAATSIYGARASNGVIVVTTTKTKKDKTEVSFSADITTSPNSYYIKNMTDANDIVNLEKGWAAGNPNLQTNAGSSGFVTDPTVNSYASSLRNNAVYTSQGMQSLLDFYSGKISESALNTKLGSLASKGYNYYKDYEKYARQSPVYQQYNLNIGKATGRNSFNASVTYKNNKFAYIYSKDEFYGVNFRNSAEITNWLTLDLGSYTSYKNSTTQTYSALNPGYSYQTYDGLTDGLGNAITSTAASRLSTYTLDNINKYGLYSMDITALNEFGMNLKKKNEFSNRTYAKLNVKIADWLKYNTMFQYEYGVDRVNQLKDKNSYAVRNMVNGMATVSASNTAVYNLPYGNIQYGETQKSTGYNFRQQLDFNKTFAYKHDFTFLLGSEIRESKLEYGNNTYYNYDSEMLSYTPVDQKTLMNTYGTIIGGTSLSTGSFAAQKELVNRFISVYSNFGYSYDNKYLLTGSLRWDRSNLWGTDAKYQNKPSWSIGGGWNIRKESFFDVAWVDLLKLRMSYGVGGNIAKNSAPYMTAYYTPNSNVGGVQGTINSRPNPALSWEKTTTTNVGIDFSVLNGRLTGYLDVYNKKGANLLSNTMGVPTEGWGYSTYAINNGEMTNKGVEITLNAAVIKTKNFEWNASFLYGYNKNEVTYVNVKAPVYYLQLDYPSAYPRIGNSYNTIYGYKWAGLSSTGLPQVYDKNGKAVSYNPADVDAIVSCGSTVPAHTGSFGTSFNYKNVVLSCLFVYRLGYKVRNTNLAYLPVVYSSATYSYIPNITTVNKQITNSWKQPGDETKTNIPRIMYGYESDFTSDLYTIYRYADINVVDASNVRLSNVSLSYQLPTSLVKRVSLNSVRFNFNVENLYTFAANNDAKYMLGGYTAPNFVLGMNISF